MDKQQARQIITATFENPFDKGRFIGFVRNLLNRIDEGSFIYKGNYIPDAYKQYIKTLERIGKFSDGESNLDILVITLQKETSLERARTMQRNFIAWYLNGSRGGEMKDAALVAYVSPDQADWRFSLVKMDYRFEKTKTGNVKVKEEFTPARRWSFLVGANEKSHTAQSRLIKILADDEQAPTLAELEKAFDIETVTKDFFFKYRELFLHTKEALDKVLRNNPKIKVDFEAKSVDTVNFAKKLLGQIVFLYFLQKKGWFGVGRDDDWGTGSKHFLRQLFAGNHGSYNNYFNDILEPLFYEALRIDRSHDDHYYSRFNCKIPFLNGGLFDPIGNYDWVHTDIHLPNDLFSNSRKTKEGDTGDGILDVFDRYNFTVREDEPLEKEVAIDPELLGKAYEKFNAIRPDNFDEFTKALKSGKKGEENKFNKKFGVYYTPREIVHYMCKQSLINYLYTQAEGAGLSPIIKQKDIEDLIEVGELITEHEATALIKQEKIKNGIQKSTEYSALLSDSIRENASAIDQWLEEITVCDPAAGSGAFPVGMMNEIVRARNVLSIFLNDRKRNDYEFKRRCIEHSLYGVDIDPGAVEIAKLRLWLSLVVDEEDIKNIKPLPNLDYKIVCGNSLLGVKKDLFNNHLFEELEKLKPLFFKETNPTRKQEYKKQIDDLISQITNGHRDFDFEVYFSEVFHKKGGFDVVIANPPYVRADSPDFKAQRNAIMKSKLYETLYEKWDLFLPFIERGLKLLSDSGNLSYITSNSLLTSKFAYRLLEFIQKNYAAQYLDYFSDDTKVFEAGVVPVVFGIAHRAVNPNVRKTIHQGEFNNIIQQKIIPISEFKALGKDAFKLSTNSFKSAAKVIPMGDICYLSYGLRPNSDERFWRGEFTRDDLVSVTKDNKHPVQYIEGKNLDYYRINKILYLEWGTDRVPNKLVRPTFPELYKKPKLIRGTITGGTYDDSGVVCNHSIVVFVRFIDLNGVENKSISGSLKKYNLLPRADLENISLKFDLKYLLAILNSKFANYFLNGIRRHRLQNYFYPDDYRKLPIADVSAKEQKSFIDLVDKILAITKDDDYLENPAKQAQVKEYERQIDQMVYELYGLTEEEIRIVESEG